MARGYHHLLGWWVQCLRAHCLLVDSPLVHGLLIQLLVHLLVHRLVHSLLQNGAWLLHLLVRSPLLGIVMRLDRRLDNRLAGANWLAHR